MRGVVVKWAGDGVPIFVITSKKTEQAIILNTIRYRKIYNFIIFDRDIFVTDILKYHYLRIQPFEKLHCITLHCIVIILFVVFGTQLICKEQ